MSFIYPSDTILEEYDGVRGNAIFCAWTGYNALSPTRAEALLSIYRNTCCPVLLLTPNNIHKWELEAAPFHETYEFLSETHKADYLRCYFMHHFGGGYTDIKLTHASWLDHFRTLRSSASAVGLGYREIGPHGVAPCGGALEAELRENYASLIGNCAYVFKKRTQFTTEWLNRTHELLTSKADQLRVHPAQHPLDQSGIILPDGRTSNYPLRWQEILGELFHPLVYEFRDKIIQAEIAPQFWGYR